MFDSILVVCTGNICRSPIGERLMQKLLPGKKISSAGIKAMPGVNADDMAIFIANKHGLSLDGHIPTQITRTMCKEFSLILAMEKEHIDAIGHLCPESRGKTMLFGYWMKQKEIPDPYKKSQESFEYIYHFLAESSEKWVQALTR